MAKQNNPLTPAVTAAHPDEVPAGMRPFTADDERYLEQLKSVSYAALLLFTIEHTPEHLRIKALERLRDAEERINFGASETIMVETAESQAEGSL